MKQTKEQRDARLAFANVMQHQHSSYKDKYGTLAHKFPVLIRTSGLMGALEYLHTRKDHQGANELLEDLTNHLRQIGLLDSTQELRDTAMDADVVKYMLLTREISRIATWYKRFSVSVLDVEQGNE